MMFRQAINRGVWARIDTHPRASTHTLHAFSGNQPMRERLP